MNQKYPEISPLNGEAKKLLVMMHGVGSDGNDLISLAPYLQPTLQDCHFMSPDGVEPYDLAPFGRQWFSLQDRTPDVIANLAAKNAPKVQEIIEAKQKELGLSNAETILFGFSQGTMMSTYLTLSQNTPYAAMIGFSGRLIEPKILKNTSTPICIIHGKDDEIVPISCGVELAEYCKGNNIEHKFLTVPNLGHSIDGSGIEFALKFLRDIK